MTSTNLIARPMADLVGPALPAVGTLARSFRIASYFAVKRALDVVFALLIGFVMLPVLPLIAAAIKIDSPGPVFYSQERIGSRRVRVGPRWVWEVRTFRMNKFRTMHVAASSALHQAYMAAYIAGDEDRMRELRGSTGTGYKLDRDPRVTKVGRVLRRLSLDELPQLWNVLRGEMSLVGPRPPLPYEVERYGPLHMRRLASVPGLTGWWQVSGRCETAFERMVELDLEYITKRSLSFDLKIIARTLPVMLSGRGGG